MSTSAPKLPLIDTPDCPDLRKEVHDSQISIFRDHAFRLADIARGVIKQVISDGLGTTRKTDGSLVTRADMETEKALREYVSENIPAAGVFGEEFGHTNPEAPIQFVVDPIDGTAEFVAGIPVWGFVLGIYFKGQPIIGLIDHPHLDLRLHAAYGQGAYANDMLLSVGDIDAELDANKIRLAVTPRRGFLKYEDQSNYFESVCRAFPEQRIYCSCFTQALSATSAIDVSLEWNLRLWDLAACKLIIEEAGGIYHIFKTHLMPQGFNYYSVIIGKYNAVQRVLEVLQSK